MLLQTTFCFTLYFYSIIEYFFKVVSFLKQSACHLKIFYIYNNSKQPS